MNVGEGVFDWLYGVITRPVETLRTVAERKPVAWAIVILAGSMVLFFVAGSSQMSFGVLNVTVRGAPSAFFPGWFVLSAVVCLVILMILHLAARLFGGKGSFAGLLSAVGFAQFPMVLSFPLVVLGRIGGCGGEALTILGSLGLALWVIALHVIALREAHKLTTGAAVGTYVFAIIIPFAVLVGLILLVIALAAALGATITTF